MTAHHRFAYTSSTPIARMTLSAHVTLSALKTGQSADMNGLTHYIVGIGKREGGIWKVGRETLVDELGIMDELRLVFFCCLRRVRYAFLVSPFLLSVHDVLLVLLLFTDI